MYKHITKKSNLVNIFPPIQNILSHWGNSCLPQNNLIIAPRVCFNAKLNTCYSGDYLFV